MIKQICRSHHKRLLNGVFWALLISLLLFLLLYRLNDFPSVWWDEGWTLDAARNWIVHGHLGHYLDGLPVPPRIPVRFPVVVPVALSMKIFGVGTWQGRLPGVVFTLLSLGLAFFLSSKMYNRRTGFATLFLMLCLSPLYFHPIVIGRQVLAEMPMMFYLLGGYSMVWLALTRSLVWSVGAALLFGVAMHAKLQVSPFWMISIALAIWMSVTHHQRRLTQILIGVAVGSIAVAAFILLAQNIVMPGSFEDPALTILLFNTIVLVLAWPIRLLALLHVFLFAFPQLLGFTWAGWRTIRTLLVRRNADIALISLKEVRKNILRAALWGLGASWLVWYLALAMWWERYMFPPFFIGCIFVAAYLDELTAGFDLRLVVHRISALLMGREFNRLNSQTFVFVIALSITFATTMGTLRDGLVASYPNPELASTYLSNHIPAGARVESFESELFFLAPEVNYHYPSDLVSMQLNRKTMIDPELVIDYDPLEADPNFLVVGPMAKFWHLYDDVTAKGLFLLDADIGGYMIYHNQTNLNYK